MKSNSLPPEAELDLFDHLALPPPPERMFTPLPDELADFREFGTPTRVESLDTPAGPVPVFINEFWTARQRQAHSLHEISYRACFKPQLPRFFIERLSEPGDIVFDPFLGRGTTLLEAALLGRTPAGNDANPLCRLLIEPRLNPPSWTDIVARLEQIPLDFQDPIPDELLVFFHEKTLREICAWRERLTSSPVDSWIRMVALNRLTGHSPGFFSVYTLPPNQATSVTAQRRINEKRNQVPEYRDTRALILRKSRQLLADRPWPSATPRFLTTGPSQTLTGIPDDAVTLTVTSPPFLDVVQYETDNWLRGWFAGINSKSVQLSTSGKIETWKNDMTATLRELRRVTQPGGHIAFEVGEVRNAKLRLEEIIVTAGLAAGLHPLLLLINAQNFTKTANCWGISNNSRGTNTNRIVLFQKEAPSTPQKSC
ncbi:MAG: DNA methyltransferase [Terrimicrobiaceae bacterium]|nr:DNA methyltransferase [Terrimicrobiaceae bacterium]